MSNQEPEGSEEELVVLDHYAGATEASLVKARLEEEGIAAMVATDDAGGMLPDLSWARGPRVMVRTSDLDAAHRILAEPSVTKEEDPSG